MQCTNIIVRDRKIYCVSSVKAHGAAMLWFEILVLKIEQPAAPYNEPQPFSII
jgi:hypothetical protein